MGSYYARRRNADGSFEKPEDIKAKNEARVEVERLWGVQVKDHNPDDQYEPIDWELWKDGKLVGYMEFKHRSRLVTEFQTVFMNFRKYDPLIDFDRAGVPGFFTVRWKCGTYKWIRVNQIDKTRVRENAGCSRMVKAKSDKEKLILVPISKMKPLSEGYYGVRQAEEGLRGSQGRLF